MAGQAHTFKASARLEEMARDPSDMGLSEQELRPNPFTPQLIPGGAKLLTGDPGASFSNAFSPSVTGDIGAGNPMRAKSKGGMVADASQKCGGVLGPAAPVVVSGDELGWEPDGLGWEPDARGSNRVCAQLFFQRKVPTGALPGHPVWSGQVAALGFSYSCLHPVRVEGGLRSRWSHVWIRGHSPCLSFHAGCLSFRQQLFCSCFPAVGNCLVILSLNKACSVDDFSVTLKVVERACQGLLTFPLHEVLFTELVSHVEPQCGMGGHITPPEMSPVGQPRVDVANEGAG